MQRSSEINELSKNTFVMQSVLPVDGCCEDLEVRLKVYPRKQPNNT